MDERKRSLRKEIVRLALPIALQQFMTAWSEHVMRSCWEVKSGCHVSRITGYTGYFCI